ncbi:hypothetical protein OUZ56_032788 [Daphnia magna]|uniref:Uncharacterized protein n=1 Tax=Daphnia magna TaxID=35525 RepID=A0ABQ9ZX46_9CRUS|nr:hypothetical protein OUZ56_032788 [Daphnia magna]
MAVATPVFYYSGLSVERTVSCTKIQLRLHLAATPSCSTTPSWLVLQDFLQGYTAATSITTCAISPPNFKQPKPF